MNNVTLSTRAIGSILGKNPWQSPWDCFVDKVSKKKPQGSRGVNSKRHGNIYEDEAVGVYKLISGNTNVIKDNKLLTHLEFPFINGKVDGIVNGSIVLEVKCPIAREFPKSNVKWTVPELYWVQVQIYMELTNLETAHYCEYYRQKNESMFRFLEIPRDKNWFMESIPRLKTFVEGISKYKTEDIKDHPMYKTLWEWTPSENSNKKRKLDSIAKN